MENLIARRIEMDKRISRAAIDQIQKTIDQIDDNRSMPTRWDDIAEFAEILARRARLIASSDRA